jgi:hypothetical protein
MPREPSETRPHVALLTSRERRSDWKAIAAIGRRQHGVISLSQLVACGFTPSGVQKLAKAGKLHRIHRGVYSLSPAALPRPGNLLAAVLACGSGTLLASRSVAGHYGLITNSSSLIDVISPHRVRRPGIRARQVPELDARDRTKHLEVPCTSVARTLLDLAAFGRPGELRSALEQAEVLGLFDLDAISDVIRRNEGRRGVGLLRSSLVAMTIDGPKLRSRFERRFLPISRSVGLGEPLNNHVIQLPGGAIEVDCYWPDHHLVVECDGYRFHKDRHAFRTDRRRDRRLAAVGIHCLRYVWEDLEDRDAIRRELLEVVASSATPEPRAGRNATPRRVSDGSR